MATESITTINASTTKEQMNSPKWTEEVSFCGCIQIY
jgi:hypothetical protein